MVKKRIKKRILDQDLKDCKIIGLRDEKEWMYQGEERCKIRKCLGDGVKTRIAEYPDLSLRRVETT